MSGQMTRDPVVFFDRMMAGSFYALIYFLPISIALVEIFTALSLIGYLVKRSLIYLSLAKQKGGCGKIGFGKSARLFFGCYKAPSNPLNKPVVAWLMVCFFSILISSVPHLSFKAFLGKSLQSAFLFFNFVEAIRTRKRLMIYLFIGCLSCFFVSLSGLSQYFFNFEFIRGHIMEHGRVNSTFRAPNDFAAYLVLVIPILVSTFFLYRRTLRGSFGKGLTWFIFITLILASCSLLVTFSRGAVLALIIGFILFGVYNFKDMQKIAIASLFFIPVFLMKIVIEREYMNVGRILSSFGRSGFWMEAINMIIAKPVFGFGLNTYSVAARDFKINWGGYPHNCYLQMTAELGVIGLASFLFIVVRLYRVFIKSFRTLKDQFRSSLALGVMTGLTGFFVHITFDTFLYSVQLGSLFWLQMALLLSLLNEDGGLIKAIEEG